MARDENALDSNLAFIPRHAYPHDRQLGRC